MKCFRLQLCVPAESILASYLLAKEARSPKCGIVKIGSSSLTNTPTLTLLKYRYPGSVRRRLEAPTYNSSKFRDHRKHLSSSTIAPTPTLNLLNNPTQTLNLRQKLKLSVKLDSYSDFRALKRRRTDLCFAICRFSQVRFITPSQLTHNLFFYFQ